MRGLFMLMRLRFLVLALALAVAALTTACGPLPRPFKPPPEFSFNPLVREVATSGIWIQTIDGISLPMSKLLAEAMAEGFENYSIGTTTEDRGNSRYRLKGRARINDDDPSLPYMALIHWTLFDYHGKVIGTETQGITATRRDWDYGSPTIIKEVGDNGSEIIAAMIDKQEQGLKPVRPRLAGLWVNPVTNAPGDGDRSLTRAIKAVIKGAGIAVAEEKRYAEFVLDGRVRVDPPNDNLQRVEIVWAVRTPDGREIGRATQKNLVEAGTFAGPWGEVAQVVADAALEGIQGVLRAAVVPRFRVGRPDRVLKTDISPGRLQEPLPENTPPAEPVREAAENLTPHPPEKPEDRSDIITRIQDMLSIGPEKEAPPTSKPEKTAAIPASAPAPRPIPEPTPSPSPAVQPSAAPKSTTIEPFIGTSKKLGKRWQKDTEHTCISKLSRRSLFCIEPVDWPQEIASSFQVHTTLYRGRKSIVRYDEEVATQFHTLFPTGNFDAIVEHFSKLLGPPTEKPVIWVVMIGKPNRKNRTARWIGPQNAGGKNGDQGAAPEILDVREIDDLRWSLPPDDRHGVVWLYRQGGLPVFRHVSWSDFLLARAPPATATRP